jgi:hypothetical protein
MNVVGIQSKKNVNNGNRNEIVRYSNNNLDFESFVSMLNRRRLFTVFANAS